MELKVSLSEEKTKNQAIDYKTDHQYEKAKSLEYSFYSSKCYGLIGNPESGNWDLSYLLTGWQKLSNNTITIDGKDASSKDLRNISCYIGHEHYYDIKPLHKHKSIKKSIEAGIKKSRKDNLTFQDIKNKFELSSERVNRRFKETGNEHWRASLAIGYAYNKKIYCSPFLEGCLWEKYYSIMLEKWLNILKNEDSIIIIPTDNEECVHNLVDERYYF